jgi:hypothetical protein
MNLSFYGGVFVSWPTPQDYNEAVQSPNLCFADSDLGKGIVETNTLGLPKSATGAFASVYKVTTPTAKWAVRCFLTERRDQEERYKLISEYVLFDDLDCTVDFHYLDKGIKVKGQWFPLVKMPWIDGPNLDVYLQNISKDKGKLAQLRTDFHALVMELELAGIAHGDLQHGNIIVSPNGLRLVDYDGLYVPSLAGRVNLEFGHFNYQHPLRDEFHFDESVDNFSSWLIHLSLTALALDPGLFERFVGGDDCILFRRSDLLSPETSALFNALLNHQEAEIRDISSLVMRMLWLPPHLVPALDATPEALGNLPYERASAIDIVRRFQPGSLDQEMVHSLQQQTASTRMKVSQNKGIGRKLNLKRMTVRLFNEIVKSCSPGIWVSMTVKNAQYLEERGSFDDALETLKHVHQLVTIVFPQDKNLELSVLVKLSKCSLLANQQIQFENYCIAASQLSGENVRFIERSVVQLGANPALVDLYKATSKIFALLSKREKQKSIELHSAFRELLFAGGELGSSVDSNKIISSVLDLFTLLLEGTMQHEDDVEELVKTGEALLSYQDSWIRANFSRLDLSEYAAASWNTQTLFARQLSGFCNDKRLSLKGELMAKRLKADPETSSNLIDECMADQNLFEIVLHELIVLCGMPNAVKGLGPGLNYLHATDKDRYLRVVEMIWGIILRSDDIDLEDKFLFFLDCKHEACSQVMLDKRYMEIVLDLVRKEFAYADRYKRIRAVLDLTKKLRYPGEQVRKEIIEIMLKLTKANKNQLKPIDIAEARLILYDFAPLIYANNEALTFLANDGAQSPFE